MNPRPSSAPRNVRTTRERIARIHARLARIECIASGTVTHTVKTCGKPNCRCAKDPSARHGPYYEWSRREGGRQINSLVSPEQARALQKAIRARRQVEDLLTQWKEPSKILMDLTDAQAAARRGPRTQPGPD